MKSHEVLRIFNRHRNLILYGAIGITGATLDFIIFVFLSAHIYFLAANIISVTLGITNNFVLNAIFNFKVKDLLLSRFVSFYSVGILGLVLSSVLLTFFVQQLLIQTLIAKLLTIVVVVLVQYMLNTRLAFKVIKEPLYKEF